MDITENTHTSSRPYCPDCGPATVFHFVERWSYRVDGVLTYLQKPPELIWRGIKPLVAKMRLGRMAPITTIALTKLGIGKIVNKPDEKNNLRATVIWEEAKKRGIAMREFRPFGFSRELFFATFSNDTVAFDGLPRPRTAKESSLDWMDNKGIILKKFRAAGIPVPKGKSCTTVSEAEKVFHSIESAVIVKPTIGSRSRHTYVDIKDIETLRHAFKKAKELCPSVVVEEELSGFVFRITLIGGKIAGIMRREAPHIVGDGEHVIRELIVKENENPLRHGPIFHELPLGEETMAILKEQSLNLDSIPKKDRMVIIHPKVSRSYGASTTEVTNIHPDNEEMFLHIARVLNDPLVGVDFMIDDIARSWKEQKCGVIECNSLPFIDLHHYPLKGPAKNPAGALWDLIFPNSALGGRGNDPVAKEA
jgi:D-alanine-D-alanine ligase-like ATP-grasp enzyme